MNRRFVAVAIGLLSLSGVLLTAFTPHEVLALPTGLYVSDNSGAIFQFGPGGTQTTFASGLDHPRGLTFDNSGNLLVATSLLDNTGNFHGTVLKFSSPGTPTTFGIVPGNNVLEDILTKSANVFVMAGDQTVPFPGTIFRFPSGGGTAAPFAPLPGQSFGLALDKMGNLFAADSSDGTIFRVASDGTINPFVTFAGASPVDITFNAAGNMFASVLTSATSGEIVEITPTGMQSIFASGLVGPRGITFDSSGNLFVADRGTGQILEFSPTAQETIFASGLPDPEFLTFGPKTVPDGGTTVMFLATALTGLGLLRRFVRGDN